MLGASTLGHTRSREDGDRVQLFQPTHSTVLPTRVPPLSGLLVDELALTERVGASRGVRLKRSSRRLQSCVLWRRHGSGPGERVGPRALGLQLWLGNWRDLGSLFRSSSIELLCHRETLRKGIGVLPLKRGGRGRRSTTGGCVEHHRLPEWVGWC